MPTASDYLAALPAPLREFVEVYVQPTAAEYAMLLSRMEERLFRKNTIICAAGGPCDQFYMVLEGIGRHYVTTPAGEATTWFSFAGDPMTDVDSFLSGQLSEVSIVAATDLRAYSISYAHLQALYEASSTWERCGRLITEKVLLTIAKRAFSLQLQSARARYEELLARQPQLLRHVPLGHIASYLGMRSETLSRIRARPTRNAV